MNLSRPTFQMVSSLNEGNRRGSIYAKIPLTPSNLAFLAFLHRIGLIAGYYSINTPPSGLVQVRFRLPGSRSTFGWIYVIPKAVRQRLPRNPDRFPHFLFMSGSLGVVETGLGLMSYSEARALHLPSRLLFRIAF